jgi:hypothetical protein
MKRLKKWFLVLGLCAGGSLFADTAFMTNASSSSIYMFDTNNPSALTEIMTGFSYPDCITISPDEQTVYFTDWAMNGVVYTFPVAGPYVATPLVTSISFPIGIAISSDGSTCFVVTNNGTPGIYSFPTGVPNPPVTLLGVIGATIVAPTSIVISGNTAYVCDYASSYPNGQLYTFPVVPSQTTYNATLVTTFTGNATNFSAVSSDGYLYLASDTTNNVIRVPLSNLLQTPEIIATVSPGTFSDGLAITSDGTTCFAGVGYGPYIGLYTFPTNQGSMQTATMLNNAITWGLAIAPGSASVTINPPTNGVGTQSINRFADYKVYENTLSWVLSTSTGVTSQTVSRGGKVIATLAPTATSYVDNASGSFTYEIRAVNASGQSDPLYIRF